MATHMGYDPYRDHYYGGPVSVSASGVVGTAALYRYPPRYYDQTDYLDTTPQPSKLILPDGVREKLERERQLELQQQAFGGFQSNRQTRQLTDDECCDEYGATLVDLKDSVTYWQDRLTALPEKRFSRSRAHERADVAESLRLARERVEGAMAGILEHKVGGEWVPV